MDEQPRVLSAYGNKRIKRRRPRGNVFLKVLLIAAGSVLLLTAAASVLFWNYLGKCQERSADDYVRNIVARTNEEGWRQILRQYFPESYPAYENGAELAYKIISPHFRVGKVTFLRQPEEKKPTYMLFSDGRRFAVMTVEEGKGKSGPQISSVKFDTGFVDEVVFPVTEIVCPEKAVLSVNGVEVSAGSLSTEACAYPELSPGEISAGPACLSYRFGDIWFAPGVSCTLDGSVLELVADEENRFYYFRFPESAMHSLKVTVPAGVTAYVGGTALTEEWAASEPKTGELGKLDDGGTGTLPMLTVWTVGGLFGETTVSASVYGKDVKLLSSENRNYVFDTPEECKYTVTVIVPKGADVTINGRAVSQSSKQELTLADIGLLGTVFGTYRVSELAAVPESVPAFDRYVVSGYLALPTVSAVLNGTKLEPCTQTVNAYDARWEFDYLLTDQALIDPARVTAAEQFLSTYVKYVCDGGSVGNPDNAQTFENNYSELLSKMMNGTSGYLSVMESYRDVNRMPHYSSFTLSGLATENYIAYTASSVSCRITCQVLRTMTVVNADGTTENVGSAINVSMDVLQVLYNGEWRIWGFGYSNGQ